MSLRDANVRLVSEWHRSLDSERRLGTTAIPAPGFARVEMYNEDIDTPFVTTGFTQVRFDSNKRA